MSSPQNNLYKLLPFNDDGHAYDLRKRGCFYPPKCATNRHQKTFFLLYRIGITKFQYKLKNHIDVYLYDILEILYFNFKA